MTETRPPDARRTPLTPHAVVEEALSLAESAGLGGVTIRRLAADLGVTPMALYWHFRNKDELLDGMVDGLYARVNSAVDTSVTWPEQLRTLWSSLLGVLRDHPSSARLVASRNPTSDSGLRVTETVLDILRRGGFTPAEATQILRHAVSTLSHLVTTAPGATSHAGGPEAEEGTRAALGSLPPESYPRLIEAAAPLSECQDPEAYFAFGLDLLLAGVEAMADSRGERV
ncbi:TetR family transcriptional regulator [Saccharomonospora piscinae]|uniref:TetR family transcriptional regulator n=1 Tax=Saccharomonospora piscinae TaxID=687388 RepID=A0A1V9A6F1_SACPI|nr:TetR/AcrR family transcriptional regulator C-terminal domain-containing protein [Saccharomonospora piscinae]OQO92628.1 TetR family transcriptional regulator [Saccharomonospora piscinae]TLW91666.1 TetR/AcrR family transcriptional regulator [Saccharomonospora piscinae]